MAESVDLWGYLVFVFFIVVIIVFLIKIFLEFPGLLEWKFLCSKDGDDDDEDDAENADDSDEVIET